MDFFYILCAIVALCIIIAIILFNRFVKLHSRLQEAWSGILVQLKKRNDLLPNLVETVKGFASHEKDVLETVTKLRSAVAPKNTAEAIDQDKNMTPALHRLFAVSERYPELKSNDNFVKLQNSLENIENDLQMSRRYFNGVVRDYNISVQSFPSLIIAQICGYKVEQFFEIDESEKTTPKISF